MKGLAVLVKKEVKELLRDPKILLGTILMPLILMVAMGGMVRISTTAMMEASANVSVAVLDMDDQPLSQTLVEFLQQTQNLNTTVLTGCTVDGALEEAEELGVKALVVIPDGFTHNITSGRRGMVYVYSIMEKGTMAEAMGFSTVEGAINVFEEIVKAQMISTGMPGADPEVVLNPIDEKPMTLFRGELIEQSPDQLAQLIMSQSMLPLILMIVVGTAMSMAATSMAVEKEAKTLETLLTLPVSRMTILLSKLIGSTIIAVIGSVSFMVGMAYYTTSVSAPATGGKVQIPTQLLQSLTSPITLAVIGGTVFITMVSAIALALCIAVYAEDVRGAQSLVGILELPIMVPAIVLMFADISMLPRSVQAVLYAIPYTHTILATRGALLGQYGPAMLSLGYIVAFTVAVLCVAAKTFSSERVITARIRLRRFKLGRPFRRPQVG